MLLDRVYIEIIDKIGAGRQHIALTRLRRQINMEAIVRFEFPHPTRIIYGAETLPRLGDDLDCGLPGCPPPSESDIVETLKPGL